MKLTSQQSYALDRIGRVNTLVVGHAGTGKSTLLSAYAKKETMHRRPVVFVNCSQLTEPFDTESRIRKPLEEAQLATENRPLLVLDSLDELPRDNEVIHSLDSVFRQIGFQVVASTRPFGHFLFHTAMVGQDYQVVELQNLTAGEISLLLREFKMTCSESQFRQLERLSNGNPLILTTLLSQLRDKHIGWPSLDTLFDDFLAPGLLLPSGQAAGPLAPELRVVVEDISTTNQTIWENLRMNPEIMRELPPRKFEETVAEMLEKQGYSVELTPAVKDGGFDIYVAKKEPIGSFLYLVECKRFVPPNKVGVHLVRALHGVVEKARANAGMLVTTSFFTKGAVEYADETKYTVQLHDFIALKKWLQAI